MLDCPTGRNEQWGLLSRNKDQRAWDSLVLVRSDLERSLEFENDMLKSRLERQEREFARREDNLTKSLVEKGEKITVLELKLKICEEERGTLMRKLGLEEEKRERAEKKTRQELVGMKEEAEIGKKMQMERFERQMTNTIELTSMEIEK